MAQMSLSMKQNRLTHTENTSVVAKGMWGIGRDMDWEFGISRYKFIYRMDKEQSPYCVAQGTMFNIP